MIEVVCGVISDSAGNVLACQRGIGRHLGGLWEFLGGKVDGGETHQAARKRGPFHPVFPTLTYDGFPNSQLPLRI